ncbi:MULTISPECIES: hypothetical protein [unclassified Dysgonomonas]|uniref:hypothetical protein n=1 Tax=unclassified Dysgonomonas TaxID=2630389 RepID=UPI0025C46050|nr:MULTISPECIES: hypothetical protein [unclassified Dysgonomonas]HMM02017.1 hypothetical protein [Dysgonomonas sp.]
MILSYKQKFPWGEPTYFREQIRNTAFDYIGSCISQYDNEGNNLSDLWIVNRKIHTIRDDIYNRWKPGMIIQHAYGVRTSNYECFATGQCIHIQILKIEKVSWRDIITDPRQIKAIEMTPGKDSDVFQLYVDGRLLNGSEINFLAKNDGFSSTADFLRWFKEPGVKKIIHFTDFKY